MNSNITILKITPFGFVFELENDSCYFTSEYDIYINGVFHSRTDKNIVSVFSLKCDTEYEVLISDMLFTVKTLKPKFVINVKDYNATGDGKTCDTSAINLAIYTAPAGAVIYIPKGVYLVDQLLLKSNVDIYLEKGAVLAQNTNRAKLGILKGLQKNFDHTGAEINASWEGHPLDCYCSVIYGNNIENVHIYGAGTIDGNGDRGDFWINPKMKNKAFRPKNIFLVECNNIEISGIISKNSASWNIHPFYSDNIILRSLKVESIETSPNTDGINPESCKNVEIVGCHFSVGDDCIAIKAGKYYMSKTLLRPCENIRIHNCYMEKGHGGVVLGSEMSCGIKNVKVSQCLFNETDRGLRIKTRRGRGNHAVVDGIIFSNVTMQKVLHPIVVNMYYNCDPDGKSDYVRSKKAHIADEFTPSIKNITVSHVTATDVSGCAIFIYGLPESMVAGVRIEDSMFYFAKKRIAECPAMMDDFVPIENLGIYINNAIDITIKNIICEGIPEAFSLKNGSAEGDCPLIFS